MLRARQIALCAGALAGCGRVAFEARPGGDAIGRDGAPNDAAAPRPPNFVQHTATTTGGPGITATAAFVDPVAAGDLIVVAFDYDADTAVPSLVSDTRGDTFSLLGPYDGGGYRQYVAYAIANGGGVEAVTVQLDKAATYFFELRIHEYADVSTTQPFDTAASASGSGASAASAPITTTSPNDLIFGLVVDGSVSAGLGFTLRGNDYEDVTEDMIAVVPGVYRVTAGTTGAWNATVVAFRGG